MTDAAEVVDKLLPREPPSGSHGACAQCGLESVTVAVTAALTYWVGCHDDACCVNDHNASALLVQVNHVA